MQMRLSERSPSGHSWWPQQRPSVRTASDTWVRVLAGSSVQTWRQRPIELVAGIFGVALSSYLLLLSVELFGSASMSLGGRMAGRLFRSASNPATRLAIGILATVLVQSSSTSTSIIVNLVGVGQITVQEGIPVIVGANIGTSITNLLICAGLSTGGVKLQRAFRGAVVHSVFNLLTAVCVLPLEIIIGAITGAGGPLYWCAKTVAGIAEAQGLGRSNPLEGTSPTRLVSKPLASAVATNSKVVVHALSLGAPVALASSWTNTSAGCAAGSERQLLTRRVGTDCSQFYCVPTELDKDFKKLHEGAYKRDLTKCAGFVAESDVQRCGSHESCYLDAGAFYARHVEQRPILTGGFMRGAGDVTGGMCTLLLAFAFLVAGLYTLTEFLTLLLGGGMNRVVLRLPRGKGALAIAGGLVLTLATESSSVTTSVLTPLCGLGLLSLSDMFPLVLGANIGTTLTALLAALATSSADAVEIALCHIFFNLVGVLIWFPVPSLRRIPLRAAELLGLYAGHRSATPAVYVFLVFVAAPAAVMSVALLWDAYPLAGALVSLALLAAVGVFEVWWLRWGGCYIVMPLEARESDGAAGQAESTSRHSPSEMHPAISVNGVRVNARAPDFVLSN